MHLENCPVPQEYLQICRLHVFPHCEGIKPGVSVFENRVLGRIFERKLDEVIGRWGYCIMKVLQLARYCKDDQIKEVKQMGGK
jgi:hypothetical protein